MTSSRSCPQPKRGPSRRLQSAAATARASAARTSSLQPLTTTLMWPLRSMTNIVGMVANGQLGRERSGGIPREDEIIFEPIEARVGWIGDHDTTASSGCAGEQLDVERVRLGEARLPARRDLQQHRPPTQARQLERVAADHGDRRVELVAVAAVGRLGRDDRAQRRRRCRSSGRRHRSAAWSRELDTRSRARSNNGSAVSCRALIPARPRLRARCRPSASRALDRWSARFPWRG